MSESFTMAGIDSKEARTSLFLDDDGEKVKVPKAMSKTFTVGKQELTVKYRIGKTFEDIRLYIRLHNCYDPESAVEHILSADEVIDRYDPKRNSDAFLFAAEELDENALTPLEKDACLDRMAWFAAVCERLADERVLEQIAQEAPKKKDGTFAKNRVTVVASCPIVISKNMTYFELVAKPKNDTQLDVTIQKRTFSRGAAQTFVNETLLTADAAVSTATPAKTALKKTTVSITYKQGTHKRVTVTVPAVKMKNGKLALDAQPYRAISDFCCVKGSDAKGYEVVEPSNREAVTLNSLGLEIFFEYDVCCFVAGWVLSVVDDINRYLTKATKPTREILERAFGVDEKGKLVSWCLTEEFRAELTYQMLCCLEGVYAFLDRSDCAQTVADHAVRKKNGKLNQGTGLTTKHPVPSATGREIPLVSAHLLSVNEGEAHVRLTYQMQYNRDNTWSRYAEE